MTIHHLAERINALYAAGKTSVDPECLQVLVELGDRADEIVGLQQTAAQLHQSLDAADAYLRDIRAENLDGSEPALGALLERLHDILKQKPLAAPTAHQQSTLAAPMTVGFYRPTAAFASEPEHIAVMVEGTGALIAITGPSDPRTNVAESMAHAAIFASSLQLLDVVRTVASDPSSPHSARAQSAIDAMPHKLDGMMSAMGAALMKHLQGQARLHLTAVLQQPEAGRAAG